MASALYLDLRGIELGLQGNALVIRRDGEYQRSIPLNLLERIVCRSSVTITTSVLASLTHRGIGVLLFGGRGASRNAAFCPAGTRDVERRIAQYRAFLDAHTRTDLCRRLLAHKLMRQRRFLGAALPRRPDRRLALIKASRTIASLQSRLLTEPIDTLETLRGIEGAAAASYFRAYAEILPPALEFSGRNRRPPRDPVNALLSLGYTLLHAESQAAVESAGLDPWLGLYHEPAHGRASLACDLSELYRWQVDELAWRLTRSETLCAHHFTTRDGACLLSKEGRAIFYPAWENRVQTLRRMLRGVALGIARLLESRSTGKPEAPPA